MKSLRESLEEQRVEVLRQMRAVRPDLVEQLMQLNAAIAGIDVEASRPSKIDEYLVFQKPSDAINCYLDRVGHAVDERDIAEALIAGGFQRGVNTRPFWNVIDAIKYHIVKTKRYKQINGLVGKADWSDELFEPPNEKGGPPESEP